MPTPPPTRRAPQRGLLALVVAAIAAVAVALRHFVANPLWARVRNQGQRGRHSTRAHRFAVAPLLWPLLALYGAVLLALAVNSVAGVWPFPQAWPQQWSLGAWTSVWASRTTLGHTLGMAVCASTLALAWAVAWLELAPLPGTR